MRANFYTLDFKKKIFLCLFLVAFAVVGLDAALYVFAGNNTSNTNFVDNKISKAEHFKLNSKKPKDIVFAGSSRTLHHISTNFFAKNNISIYNFGVSGNFIGDYPFIVNAIKKVGAKDVVISLRVSFLFDNYAEYGFKIYTTDELVANFGTDKMIFLFFVAFEFISFILIKSQSLCAFRSKVFFASKLLALVLLSGANFP